MSFDSFRGYYWYRDELAAFCRANGLASSGQKHELILRVEAFLTGAGPKPEASPARTRPARAPRTGPITPDTPVGEDFRCNAETRAFFKSVIGDHFHFTAHIQRYRRERQRAGTPLTYGDLAREWVAEHERRKEKGYQSVIAPTWQYNQFVRDFLADKPRNTGKGIGDAATAWKTIREERGPHTYAEYVRLQEAGPTRPHRRKRRTP
ncbi:DUF6434 domain-containing protein [Streptomyces rishiriensis]|uniref:DUF6434 domain-containing protein n=1 Tax=Streptomyces rishiriensis TaxID=68264 RepID=UPI0033D51E85